MIVADDFHINNAKVVFKRDEYPLSKIRGARVKTNSLKDHVLRVVIIGLIVSSVVWMICPDSLGLLTAPVALIVGILSAMATVRKYELQIEFQHIDETGLQWVSIAKTNKLSVKELFEKQASEILRNIT
ncbi:hypothetical protein PTW35_23100 (plasmid) [Photobacterium sp. DA100]|uniref:hypothetical protein n=1 Tax=Photobacterium sp. DA100 TaxID=3027472 RepID=UPI0024786AF2|nr:hypothetical protein [Photobacterium sp. DA100]WEM44178.1 hypothetical protein PTW35_23100 [Photobacterium sp. DA100]